MIGRRDILKAGAALVASSTAFAEMLWNRKEKTINEDELINAVASMPTKKLELILPAGIDDFIENGLRNPAVYKEFALEELRKVQNKSNEHFSDLIVDIFNKTPLFDMVSIQPSSGTGTIALNCHGKDMEEPVVSCNCERLDKSIRLDPQLMMPDIERHVIGTIRKNAGYTKSFDLGFQGQQTIKELYEQMYVGIAEVANVIEDKIGFAPNWIITSPEIASIFEASSSGTYSGYIGHSALCPSKTFHRFGKNNIDIKVYKDYLFPPSQMLIGYKGDLCYDAGYLFLPKCIRCDKCDPLNSLELNWDNEFYLDFGESVVNKDYFANVHFLNIFEKLTATSFKYF